MFGQRADLLVCSSQPLELTPALMRPLEGWQSDIGPVEIIDANQRTGLSDWLSNITAIPPTIIDFAINGVTTGSNFGANRNVAALLASGRHVFSFDDDTIGVTSFARTRKNNGLHSSHPVDSDPIEYWANCSPDASDQIERITTPVDILAAHHGGVRQNARVNPGSAEAIPEVAV